MFSANLLRVLMKKSNAVALSMSRNSVRNHVAVVEKIWQTVFEMASANASEMRATGRAQSRRQTDVNYTVAFNQERFRLWLEC